MKVDVVGTERRSGVTFFKFEVEHRIDGGRIIRWSICRRFRDCFSLHQQIVARKLCNPVPSFPKKNLLAGLSSKIVQRRQLQLAAYFSQLAAAADPCPAALSAFFEVKAHATAAHATAASPDHGGVAQEVELYRTSSICPSCSIVQRRGFTWRPAVVVEKQRKSIWLRMQCPAHGLFKTLYCSSATFFRRLCDFEAVHPPSKGGLVPDTEYMLQSLQCRGTVDSLPCAFSIQLDTLAPAAASADAFEVPAAAAAAASTPAAARTISQFKPDHALKHELMAFRTRLRKDRHYVCRVGAGSLFTDTRTLVKKIGVVVRQLPMVCKATVWAECPAEAFMAMCKMRSSLLLHPRVMPAIQMYVMPGDEESALQQLRATMAALKRVSRMQAVVVLGLDRPFPDLSAITAYLRAEMAVRIVLLQLERSPKRLIAAINRRPAGGLFQTSETQRPPFDALLDPLEIAQLLETATKREVCVADMIPLRAVDVVNPLITAVGFGNYDLDANPLSCFGTVLCNFQPGGLRSVPLPRLLNLAELHREFLPVARKLHETNEKKSGWLQRMMLLLSAKKKLTKSFKGKDKSAATSGMPDLTCLFKQDGGSKGKEASSASPSLSKVQAAQAFVNQLQVWAVSSPMDFASLDGSRFPEIFCKRVDT